ncbi:MAG: GNAT family N-acetyltransferase, partial [Phycisphaerales bacterium JB064]
RAGLCTEAVVAMTELSLRERSDGGLGLRRLEIRCSAENTPSARVAEKAGYTLEARLRAHRWVDGLGWSDTLIFGTTADTWTKP